MSLCFLNNTIDVCIILLVSSKIFFLWTEKKSRKFMKEIIDITFLKEDILCSNQVL